MVGKVTLHRRHLNCPRCRNGECVADDLLGLNDYWSPILTRVSARLGVQASFDKATELLTELYGVRASHTTVRTRTHRLARKAASWQEPPEQHQKRFDPRHGEAELTVDAGKVNTREEGWKDLKLEVWTLRKAGPPVLPEEWNQRKLPACGPRSIHADIAHHSEFTAHWPTEAERMGVPKGERMTFLGDGADWIWDDRKKHLPASRGVLDIYHASEKLHEVGRALHHDGSTAKKWGDDATLTLIRDGWAGLEPLLEQEIAKRAGKGASTALYEARTYFVKKKDYLDYRGQLAAGRVIGSGQVEGEAKQMGLRLKAGSARWKLTNVKSFAKLCAMHHARILKPFSEAAIP